jgi:hypothetical protein
MRFLNGTGGNEPTSAAEIVVASVDGLSTLTLSQKTNGENGIRSDFHSCGRDDMLAKVTNHHPDAAVVMGDAFRFAFQNTAPTPTPSLSTPTPTETPSGQARPFGEYVQAVIDELEARKANDVSAI